MMYNLGTLPYAVAASSFLSMENITYFDYTAVFMCAMSLVLFSWTGKRNSIDRLEGVVLVLIQLLYFGYLFMLK